MKNVGTVDRIVRLLVAVAIVVAYATGWIGGTLAIVLGVVAAAMTLTGLVSFCPAYRLLGINSCGTR